MPMALMFLNLYGCQAVRRKLNFVQKFLLHPFLNQLQIIGVTWMGLKFYDYHDYQKNQGGYRLMKNTVSIYVDRSDHTGSTTLL